MLEKTLNEFGIYHYHQIAGLKKADIAEIDEALNFKGRIEISPNRVEFKSLEGMLTKIGMETEMKEKRFLDSRPVV